MLRLPATPISRTTRYLDCVSCHERFAVSEEFLRENQEHRTRQSPANQWTAVPNGSPFVRLRDVVWNGRRLVYPTPRAEPRNPHELPHGKPRNTQPVHLNCPRCGADNRNWAQILAHPDGLRHLDAGRFPFWEIAIMATIVIFAVLFTGTYYLSRQPEAFLYKATPLIVILLLAGALPFISLAPNWRAMLNHRHEERYLANASPRHPALIPGLIWFIIVTIGIPLATFWIVPRSLDLLFTSPSEEAQATFAALDKALQFDQGEIAALTAEQVQEVREDIDSLQAIVSPGYPQEQEVQELITQLRRINLPESANAQTHIRQLERYLRQVRSPLMPIWGFWDRTQSFINYLVIWFVLVSAVYIASIFFGNMVADRTARQVERIVPPPVYSSIASMTRVVLWDAKHSLEIAENLDLAHWEAAEWLPGGGLRLRGTYCEEPVYDQNERVDEKVTAYHYDLQTDRWAHVVHARVREDAIPARPGTQKQVSTGQVQIRVSRNGNGRGPDTQLAPTNGSREPAYQG